MSKLERTYPGEMAGPVIEMERVGRLDVAEEVRKSAAIADLRAAGQLHVTPFHQFITAVRDLVEQSGVRVSTEWWDGQRARLELYHRTGETPGLAAISMRVFAVGARADQEAGSLRRILTASLRKP